ncbi:MAG: CBS domain-containing protein [Kiritimatiellia bacterium]|nr:CBS domain-containing protein [Kiritimatiellia bacterium]
MKVLPIETEQSPLVILDLLFKLKIKDVMTSRLITATRRDTLRTVQRLMKENSITGVPVAEDGRIFGIVSMDDIINALEGGYIDDPVEQRMSRKVVVLEEDMPLSFGTSYFDKYKFGRFPVLNRENRLVGILSSRDVSASLLLELFKEYRRLEQQIQTPPPADFDHIRLQFKVRRHDFENAGKVSYEIKRILTAQQVDPQIIRRAAIAGYEMEMNQIVHSTGGVMTCSIDSRKVEITARDLGPGIEDVDAALSEGFTTANDWIKSLGFGAGMGLPNIRRVANQFDIQSKLGSGTTVRATILLQNPPP